MGKTIEMSDSKKDKKNKKTYSKNKDTSKEAKKANNTTDNDSNKKDKGVSHSQKYAENTPKKKEFSVFETFLIFGSILLLIIIAATVTFFIVKFFFADNIEAQDPQIIDSEKLVSHSVKGIEDSNKDDYIDYEKENVEITTDLITSTNQPAYEGTDFFEELTAIDGQDAYIAHPMVIDPEDLPSIIIYSHGSITNVVQDMEDIFMKEVMREYGDFFTAENYIFAASNQHGENWGNALSVEDTRKLVEYIETNYQVTPEVYLIGYSMGSLPTWEYMFKNPDKVVKTALLAPTPYSAKYGFSQFELIKEIPITIWHGTADTNIEINTSRERVARASRYGKEIVLVELEGETHWDVDTELMPEIAQFFSE